MTNNTRSSDALERDIVNERAEMSDTINSLQEKFSFDSILGDLSKMFRTEGGDIGQTISQTVGRNPAAVMLVGVGLAWLFLGQDRSRSVNATADTRADGSARNRNQSSYETWYQQAVPSERSNGGPAADRDHGWRGNAGGSQNSSHPNGASSGMMGSIQGAASAVGDAVSGAAGSLGDAASDLTERLSHGLEDLSEEARSRVLAARHAAHEARLASTAAMSRGSQFASDFFEEQPLVVGALAFAMGAALGGVLPHSKIEDDTMGNSSDQLFATAQTMFRDERDKAMSAVSTAATDAMDEINDLGSDLTDLLPDGKTAGEAIVDRAADAASRIFDHATGNGKQGSDRGGS